MLCVCVHARAHAYMHMGSSVPVEVRVQLIEAVLSFWHVVPGMKLLASGLVASALTR